MAASTTKKVCISRFDGQLINGYVAPQTYLRPEGAEVLDRSAQALVVPYQEIKAVYFVREFDGDPISRQKSVFTSRPKKDGLWVRLSFRDGEVLEGILANNLLLVPDQGMTITPPDPNANAQRVFVLREALSEVTVLGVIGAAARRGRRKAAEPSKDQIELFENKRSGS